MPLARLAAAVCTALLLAACVQRIERTDLGPVAPGAARADIEARLGSPLRTADADGRTVATYGYDSGWVSTCRDGVCGFVYMFSNLLPHSIPIVLVHNIVVTARQRGEIDVTYDATGSVIGTRAWAPDYVCRRTLGNDDWRVGECRPEAAP
jgi:hypothetical protein